MNSMTINWNKKASRDKSGFWTDYTSEDGKLLIAQGYNELEKAQGCPWALFKVEKDDKWLTLGFFKSVEEAQKSVETTKENG